MKIAIVGGSPSSENLAPYDDETWKIWVHGNQMDRHLAEGRRVDRIFEIHADLSEHQDKYPEWLVAMDIPMLVSDGFPIRMSGHVKRFPVDAANELMGGEHLTSTPAYMMAAAILDGAEEIAIYGVDMAVDDHEYFLQRPSMYAWIAFAKARGIKVTIPPESPLFVDPFVEGRDANPVAGLVPFTAANFLEMAQVHIVKLAELRAEVDRCQVLVNTHDGCRQAYVRLAKVARAVESGQTIETLSASAVVR